MTTCRSPPFGAEDGLLHPRKHKSARQLRRKRGEPEADPDPRVAAAVIHGQRDHDIIAKDPNPTTDLLDVEHDIATIAEMDASVNWGWYQQGFNTNDASDPFEPQGRV